MSDHVSWILTLEINAGREADLRTLMAEMVAATQAAEPGALDYEWHISDDGKVLHTFERYADSAATLKHLGNFGAKFAGRFMEIVRPTAFTVYGSPSTEVRTAMSGFGPVFMERIGGFSR